MLLKYLRQVNMYLGASHLATPLNETPLAFGHGGGRPGWPIASFVIANKDRVYFYESLSALRHDSKVRPRLHVRVHNRGLPKSKTGPEHNLTHGQSGQSRRVVVLVVQWV
jgi:hypothetical protein